ncbi:MAG: response regulator transcription factor [Pseudomonadota bacterium]
MPGKRSVTEETRPPAHKKLRIAVVDDSFLIREGLAQILSLSPDIEVCGSYAEPTALYAALESLSFDVVLTDIRMPPTLTDEGIRLADRLRETHPQMGVVVMSQHEQVDYAERLLVSGAARRAYLLKERIHDLDHLVATIKAIAAGECRVDPQLVENLVKASRHQRSPLDDLTPRQREILADVAIGKSNAAIAQERHLTQRAVEKHVSEIFGRLGLTDDHQVSRRVYATLIYLQRRPG